MTTLPFTMQKQVKSNWCWAAVAASAATFYNGSTPWTQCRVANSNLNRGDCCGSPAGDPCNVTSVLDRPLTIVNCFDRMVNASVPESDAVTEIVRNHPLCLRVRWSDGSGHFLAIVGYGESVGVVFVDDPIYGSAAILYSVLRTRYQGSGTWTHSYFTTAR
ncbi:papain-like cysteine protease family protein [Streptomyces sp. NPDC057702]|uniref:papain-like cysteine protease family protein n=1 Tax=unclassified Streptomyces TaxID=2593676 RepID=UPI003690428F